jgi:hypothetical protein
MGEQPSRFNTIAASTRQALRIRRAYPSASGLPVKPP